MNVKRLLHISQFEYLRSMISVLLIGHTFPEPFTTAAGGRTMQLIGLFQEMGCAIHFAATASPSKYAEDLSSQGIQLHTIALNNSSFDAFIRDLAPNIVVFDRFMMEEQFGWRVAENCPNALRIIDTQDLHFLRKAREQAVKERGDASSVDLFTDVAKRELASILRSDLSIIISEAEMKLLEGVFSINKDILLYLPLFAEVDKEAVLPTFEERQHFMTIGSFRHPPNVDAVLQLHQHIWPSIRKQLPKVELHIYGAYVPQRIQELHNPKQGFLVKGWAPSAEEVTKAAKVCLAPLRFGAGLKGKHFDAMRYGTPAVATPIGAEGLCSELPFGGSIAKTNEDFIDAAVSLYTEKELWQEAQQNGFNILQQRFRKDLFENGFQQNIKTLHQNLQQHRQENFLSQILHHQTLQASKYMSKWIEAKNR